MPNSNSFERVRQAVEAQGLNWREAEPGRRASFQTPGHSEADLGTAVTYIGTQTLLHCFNNGGDTKEILDALGLDWRDLYDSPEGVTYTYSDGRQVVRKPRRDNPKCHFTQMGDTKGRALFGLKSLKDHPTGPVYIVEGEKDVQTAVFVLGVPAVSQCQGASTSPSKADWSPLQRRSLIIVADKDEPGYKRAGNVYNHLLNNGLTDVRIVEAKEGKDLSDHVAAGLKPEDLQPVKPPARRESVVQPRRVFEAIRAVDVKPKKVDWFIPNWIPCNSLTLLTGREGLGKSTIACRFAADATRGKYGGKPMNVAYIATEDSLELTVRPRLEAAGADLNRALFLRVKVGENSEGALTLPKDEYLLSEFLEKNEVGFMVLDAAKSSMDSSLNGYNDQEVRLFLEPLTAMADRLGVTILGITHLGKRDGKDTGKSMLGSIAWSQVARSVLTLAADPETHELVMTNTKGNLAREKVSQRVELVSTKVKIGPGEVADVARAEWGEFTDVSAEDYLAVNMQDGDRGDLKKVILGFLERQGGSALVEEVRKEVKAAGLNYSKADGPFRDSIGVSLGPSEFGGRWVWSIDSFFTSKTVTDEEPGAAEKSEQSAVSSPVSSVSTVSHVQGTLDETVDDGVTLDSDGDGTRGEIDRLILDSLHTEYPLSVSTVKNSIPKVDLERFGIEDLQPDLDRLQSQGLVTVDKRGRYLRAVEKSA